jgi:hypothetical protein
MLDKMKSGDRMQEDGTMEELKNACDNAIQKIKNMMKDEDDGAKRGMTCANNTDIK